MYISLEDGQYWYETYGEGIPVVLLHGFTGSTETWNDFLRSVEGIKVITIDLPGHGKTELENPRFMEDCCKDLDMIFETIGLDSFHLLGYSMGGRTALSYACLYPERLQSLILESASPGLLSNVERTNRIENDERLAEKLEKEGIQSFIDFWENIPLFSTQKNLPASVKEAIRKERLNQDAVGLATSLRYMGTGKQPSWWKDLSTIPIPVFLLTGEKDEKFVRINKKMQKLFFSCKLKVCENVGHAIHVENPEIFGKLVTEFVKEVHNRC
ncbi:2-succinyl-6-hydroxy-2,4-cyclohexadiene-1-carboxylate synthase [Oceanobacillus sp. Castelsardo]|uniref:2-succinyl-6-hydroxy-2, 4-cyclohexadiene-1-carboxylate synthase n=1 Tax=Oceanobacillus sp. Castelsardo TaxID=1851204 RepID=UPI0008385486|nr:2-succinyl-6-hydroxy-2,4-cyclohexadiene-1-carboxylate synthase [Oceanobacillus sp. Castelsardo]